MTAPAGGQPSDEASPEQLRLARDQGEAFLSAVKEMVEHEAHGGQKRAGDYVIGFAQEDAEGMYELVDGTLQWREPDDENAHFEVVVLDATDHRFIPGLEVHLTVRDSEGREMGTHRQPFLWHPWLYHYGRNWVLPGDGVYDLTVRVEPAPFPRHDRANGRRFAEAVEVEFTGVEVQTGKKTS